MGVMPAWSGPAQRHRDQGAGPLRPFARRRRGGGSQLMTHERAEIARERTRLRRVETIDVEAVNRRSRQKFYQARDQDLPEAGRGLLPPAEMGGHGGDARRSTGSPRGSAGTAAPIAPDQAVLVDLANRRFYFFFIEIWPQEFYYVAGLLIMAGLGLFLVTSVAGRVWCGYTCPQTVWTDLFIWVERLIEGDRNARMKLDKAPWRSEKIAKRAAVYVGLAADRGGDRRRLDLLLRRRADAARRSSSPARRRPSPTSPSACSPRPPTSSPASCASRSAPICAPGRASRAPCSTRIRSSSPTTTGAASRARATRRRRSAEGLDVGDCVDCNACVAVCPMGIDIRDGNQLECITCAFCIDACDGGDGEARQAAAG